jgi:hypothetical protein
MLSRNRQTHVVAVTVAVNAVVVEQVDLVDSTTSPPTLTFFVVLLAVLPSDGCAAACSAHWQIGMQENATYATL